MREHIQKRKIWRENAENNANGGYKMKIDVSKIPNFDSLPEDVKTALENYKIETPEPDFTGYIPKAQFDKTASELADVKKQLKARMTEDEQKEAERLAAEQALKEELETLRKAQTLSENKARFLGLGYDEKLALETAQALVDGDMDKVFANQQIHIENVKKAERAAGIANDPTPPAGGGGETEITKEQFDKMGYTERLKLFNEQPEVYQKMIGEI